jgi:hypothetical protein
MVGVKPEHIENMMQLETIYPKSITCSNASNLAIPANSITCQMWIWCIP